MRSTQLLGTEVGPAAMGRVAAAPAAPLQAWVSSSPALLTNGGSVATVKPQAQTQQPPGVSGVLQTEVARRQLAESRVLELEALVARLRQRIAFLEGGGRPGRQRHSPREPSRGKQRNNHVRERDEHNEADKARNDDDSIDSAICEYLERNPDFPVTVRKVQSNYYVFGDRGIVNVTKCGEHIVVRVGGGFKSLQVFMDERALMVSGASNAYGRRQAEKASGMGARELASQNSSRGGHEYARGR